MKNLKLLTALIFCITFINVTVQAQDWPNLGRFKSANEALGSPVANEERVVFMGNSITEGWQKINPDFFTENKYINRGISGQTTPQMLIRFRPDVVKLSPKVVIILAGTNDIAGNTGPSTLEMILDNMISMSELARANGINVILCSVLPAYDYSWRPGIEPAQKIMKINEMLKDYCAKNKVMYLDYYSSMVDERGGMKAELTKDGVHPNLAGYKIMEPLAKKAIKRVLKISRD